MTKPIPGIKIPFFIADQYPEVAGFRCVQIHIPDDPLFMALLGGLLKLPARAFNWKGADFAKRLALASMWRNAYDFNDWCECMDCESLQECLQPLFDALREQINQDAIFRQYGTDYPTGVPLPPEAAAAPLAAGSNPACDPDIVWSQCEQLVEFSNTMITDCLELFENATNDIEFAQVLSSLPVMDELGVDALADYISLLQEAIAENYEAAFTLEYAQQLACEIFCLCRVDCEITIDRVYNILKARVEEYTGSPMGTINVIQDFLSYLIGQEIDGDIVADAMLSLLWAGGKLINSFLVSVGTKQLETVLELAVNDANDDWEILCDCPNCDDEFELEEGTEVTGGEFDGWQQTEDPAEVVELVNVTIGVTAWGCRLKYVFPTPRTSVYIQYDCTNLGGGSGDTFNARIGDWDMMGDWIGGDLFIAPSQAGEMLITSDIASTVFYIDLGYTNESGSALYLNNNRYVKILQSCE